MNARNCVPGLTYLWDSPYGWLEVIFTGVHDQNLYHMLLNKGKTPDLWTEGDTVLVTSELCEEQKEYIAA